MNSTLIKSYLMETFLTILFIATGTVLVPAQVNFENSYNSSGGVGKYYLTTTFDGGYAIAGNTQTFGAGSLDVYLIRTNSTGNVLWTKTYGGSLDEQAIDVKQTADTGFIITGSTRSFGAGSDDMFLIRTDKNGDTLWTKTYGSALSDNGFGVEPTSDGGFIAVGNWGGSTYNSMVRTNAAGDTLWTKIFDVGNPFSIIQNADKGFTVCGTGYVFSGAGLNLFLYRTDSIGNVIWCKSYGGAVTEYGYQVIKANDGGYIAIGFSSSFGLAGNEQAYIVHTDTSGNLIWSRTYDQGGTLEGASIVSTGTGYALLCRNTVNVQLNYWTTTLILIDNQGAVLGAKSYDGASPLRLQTTADGGFAFCSNGGIDLHPLLIKTDGAGNLGCGDSSTTIIVATPATQVDTITPHHQYGTIVGVPSMAISSGGTATAMCTPSSINDVSSTISGIQLFPNPTSGSFTISFADIINKGSAEIYTALGEKIFERLIFNGSKTKINFKGISAGMYFVRVIADKKQYTTKLIVE